MKRLPRRKPKDAERSGINGAGTSTQKAKGITDNGEIFLADTLKGGAKKPEIAKVNAVGTYSTRGWGVGRGVRQCGAVWGGDERWRWALGAWGWLFTALFKKAQRRRMVLQAPFVEITMAEGESAILCRKFVGGIRKVQKSGYMMPGTFATGFTAFRILLRSA